ncbi:transposon Ty3-I Gag-Pol polyprotein [Nephila pilipes]|uniref:Transposon Ty3-I Gag-Pol polyprotein n=1 Tax=Nephila pilipes TaxID=299642 RepID=A0A8X6N0J2_NEPPI|nr:transposon Ty3-I Gag-Pol polyprotein [Nephila pilipes]
MIHLRSYARKSAQQLELNDEANLSFKAESFLQKLSSKDALVNATLLRYPIPGAELNLWVYDSNEGVSVSLMQLSNIQWELVAFYSTKLNKSQRNWPAYDLVLFLYPCQQAKLTRHSKPPIVPFSIHDAHFAHIHIYFIGPLPFSEGNQYCLTITDRFSRWPGVISTPDMRAKTVARSLMHGCISRFGCPVSIKTYQGTNFQSNLFREITRMLGYNKIRNATYYLLTNGIIERLHHHLKSTPKMHNQIKWTKILPIVLLGLCSRRILRLPVHNLFMVSSNDYLPIS